MANRLTVTICDQEYTLVADESAEYMEHVAAFVSGKLSEILAAGRVGRADAAVLAAVNITDEFFKLQNVDEQLRSQIKDCLDETAKAQNEVSELKREVFRLQQRLDSRNKNK